MTDTKLQIQKGHRTPSKIHSKPKGEKKLPRYMRGRGKVKEKILKTAREEDFLVIEDKK